jgi:hypothetical protein
MSVSLRCEYPFYSILSRRWMRLNRDGGIHVS